MKAVASMSSGYDDTLKNGASGRYGKIILHISGKAYIFIGGEKMLLDEGLPCGFVQQTVSIDPNSWMYIYLGYK